MVYPNRAIRHTRRGLATAVIPTKKHLEEGKRVELLQDLVQAPSTGSNRISTPIRPSKTGRGPRGNIHPNIITGTAHPVGIEPTLTGLESVVLPLDEGHILDEAPDVIGFRC